MASASQDDTRLYLRVAAIVLVFLGGVFVIAFWSAANAAFDQPLVFGTERQEPPFALGAIGGIMLVAGMAITRWAFLRPAASYAAGEVEPAVRELARAAAEGASEVKASASRACLVCGVLNDRDAQFCDACGKPMPRPASA